MKLLDIFDIFLTRCQDIFKFLQLIKRNTSNKTSTKSDVSAEKSGHFPAVLEATTPDVCDVASGHKTIFLTKHQDIFLTVLVATKNWCF